MLAKRYYTSDIMIPYKPQQFILSNNNIVAFINCVMVYNKIVLKCAVQNAVNLNLIQIEAECMNMPRI